MRLYLIPLPPDQILQTAAGGMKGTGDGLTKLLLRRSDLLLLPFSSCVEEFFRIHGRGKAADSHFAAGHNQVHLHLKPIATAEVTMSQLDHHVAPDDPFVERIQLRGLLAHPGLD